MQCYIIVDNKLYGVLKKIKSTQNESKQNDQPIADKYTQPNREETMNRIYVFVPTLFVILARRQILIKCKCFKNQTKDLKYKAKPKQGIDVKM